VNFKQWMEATVSSEDIGTAMKKTLEFKVDGHWKVQVKNEPNIPGVKILGELRNHKTAGASYFLLSAYAIFGQPLFAYDSVLGGDKLKIACSMLYMDGKGGYAKLGERSSLYGGSDPSSPYGLALKTPFELAHWVKSVVDGFSGFGSDGDDNDEEPSPSQPEPSNSRLVTT
jgi:hypothetical protein